MCFYITVPWNIVPGWDLCQASSTPAYGQRVRLFYIVPISASKSWVSHGQWTLCGPAFPSLLSFDPQFIVHLIWLNGKCGIGVRCYPRSRCCLCFSLDTPILLCVLTDKSPPKPQGAEGAPSRHTHTIAVH